eukprot:366071-Chlamydomonas_euryale.AAC.3
MHGRRHTCGWGSSSTDTGLCRRPCPAEAACVTQPRELCVHAAVRMRCRGGIAPLRAHTHSAHASMTTLHAFSCMSEPPSATSGGMCAWRACTLTEHTHIFAIRALHPCSVGLIAALGYTLFCCSLRRKRMCSHSAVSIGDTWVVATCIDVCHSYAGAFAMMLNPERYKSARTVSAAWRDLSRRAVCLWR